MRKLQLWLSVEFILHSEQRGYGSASTLDTLTLSPSKHRGFSCWYNDGKKGILNEFLYITNLMFSAFKVFESCKLFFDKPTLPQPPLSISISVSDVLRFSELLWTIPGNGWFAYLFHSAVNYLYSWVEKWHYTVKAGERKFTVEKNEWLKPFKPLKPITWIHDAHLLPSLVNRHHVPCCGKTLILALKDMCICSLFAFVSIVPTAITKCQQWALK